MGHGAYLDHDHNLRATTRATTGRSAFGYTQDIQEGKAQMILHASMDIKGKIRESRDSAEHPSSVPIAIVFDQTGSMAGVPVVFQKHLPKLMAYLLQHGVVVDPQILIGAVGDYTDRVRQVQLGQFESDVRMEDSLDTMVLERNGGGTGEESYLQVLYAAATHMSCDAFEKRGKKGYCNTPDAPIWMADQTFKPIGEVRSGDAVMGWERLNGHRSLVTTTVEAVQRRRADNVVKVTLASGRSLTCTADHRWLSGHHGKLSAGNDVWTSVINRYGKGALLSHVIDPLKPVPVELREGAAWLAGVYDGEGSANGICQYRGHNPDVCQRIEEVLCQLGFAFKYRQDSYFLLGGLPTYVKMLQMPIVRRRQLLDMILSSKWGKYAHKVNGCPPVLSRTDDRVVKVEDLPAQDVVSMQTTTHNYVAWGYASSNCFISGDELYYGTRNFGRYGPVPRLPSAGPDTRRSTEKFYGLTRDEIEDVFGDRIEAPGLTPQRIYDMASEKWEIFFIVPQEGTHGGRSMAVRDAWANLIGRERVIVLEHNDAICECIAGVISRFEGTYTPTMAGAIQAVGIDPAFLANLGRVEV